MGSIMRQLMSVTTILAPTPETGKIDLGKYTKCIVRTFPVKELVAAFSDFEKQPHTMTPNKTQTAYILSGFPLNMMNRNQYTEARSAGSITVHAYSMLSFDIGHEPPFESSFGQGTDFFGFQLMYEGGQTADLI